MSLQMCDCESVIAQSHQVQPERPDAWLSIALAGEEPSAKLSDQVLHIPHRGRLFGQFPPVEHVDNRPFDFAKEQIGWEVEVSASDINKVSDAPRHHQVICPGQLMLRSC